MVPSPTPTAPFSSICKLCNNATWVLPSQITFHNIILPGIRCAPDHGPANAYQAHTETSARLSTAREKLERHLAALQKPWSYLKPAAVVAKNVKAVKRAEKCVSVQGRRLEDVHQRIVVVEGWRWGFWTGGRSLRTRAQEVVWELWTEFWAVVDLLTSLAEACEKARRFYGDGILGVRAGGGLGIDVEAVQREKVEIVAARAAAVADEEEEERMAMREMEAEAERVGQVDGKDDSGYESADNLKRRRSETVDYDAEGETDDEAHDDKRARIASQ